MVSYPHRPKSGHITCYLNRTYHVLTTDQRHPGRWRLGTCLPERMLLPRI